MSNGDAERFVQEVLFLKPKDIIQCNEISTGEDMMSALEKVSKKMIAQGVWPLPLRAIGLVAPAYHGWQDPMEKRKVSYFWAGVALFDEIPPQEPKATVTNSWFGMIDWEMVEQYDWLPRKRETEDKWLARIGKALEANPPAPKRGHN